MKKSLLTLFLGTVASGLFAQTTVTLTPSKDAAIGYDDGASTASNNYGSAVQAAAYCIPAAVAPPPGVNKNRALFDFNFASIPTGATITSAKLNLYATGPIGSLQGHTGNNVSYLERIIQSWGEFTVTWNNQPTTTSQNHITLPQSTSPAQDYLNIDVLPLVQDIIANPSTSYGFQMRLVNEVVTNALIFYSKDNGNSAKIPTLVIGYTTAAGIHEQTMDSGALSIFPNPSSSAVTINYSNDQHPGAELSIVSCDGLVIKKQQVLTGNTTLDVTDLAPGVYLARINSSSGTRITGKFVVTK